MEYNCWTHFLNNYVAQFPPFPQLYTKKHPGINSHAFEYVLLPCGRKTIFDDALGLVVYKKLISFRVDC